MIYLNVYYCDDCEEEWESYDETTCNGKCPVCGQHTEPITYAPVPEENSTLLIYDVNLPLLEVQRKHLNDLADNVYVNSAIDLEQKSALAGIVNMLNEWSDRAYYEKKEKRHDRRRVQT